MVVWLSAGWSFAAVASDDVTRRVDEIFKDWARTDSPGCSVAASQNGSIVLERGYGMADLEQGVAIRPDTVFNIASVSKQFTAASLLLLQEQGKLSLADDVRKYVPELPDYGKRITLRHLANHTSGLRDLPTLLALGGWNWVDAVPSEQALDVISRQKQLNFAPGAKYSYSNTGYYLMALIVERVSGQPFGEFTQQQIFQPLGMLHSRFYDDRRMIMKNRAIGHLKLAGGGFGVWRPTYEIVGDGALLTTVQDLAIWDRNFLQPRLGRDPQRLATDMVQAAELNDGSTPGYALGLMLGEYRGLPIVSHSGGVPGYATMLMRFPEQKFAVTVLCNVGGAPARAAAKAVADIYLDGQFPKGPETPVTRPQPQAPTKAARQPSARELAKFTGVYVNEELSARYRLKVSGDQLVAVVGYLPPLPFYAVDAKRFYNEENDLTMSFAGGGFVLGTGEVQGLTFARAGR
jgi:CubicO group peptidase (beta-lactamase class C family)